MIILNKFYDDKTKPIESVEYGDALGSMFLCWYDANKHIEQGHFVTIEVNNTTSFYDKRIEF